MNRTELVKALKRLKVQTGSLACLGCGREHNCSAHGCAIIRAAVEELEKMQWVSVEDGLPRDETDGETVIAAVCGKPHENITLHSAIMTAGYFEGEGWVVNEYPAWENPTVTHWMPAPELPEERSVKDHD